APGAAVLPGCGDGREPSGTGRSPLQGTASLTHRPSRLLDRCPLGVDELPAPVPPNEHAGPATLLIKRPLLVLPFGGGAIGHHGGIPVEAGLAPARRGRT